MTPGVRTIRAWAVIIVVGTAASLLFALAKLPSPVLFGSLLAGMAHALVAKDELDMPPIAFRIGQALVGAVIGALVQLSTLARLAHNWPSVALVTVGTLAISVAAGRLLAIHRDVSPATGAFALIAGGASGIVALARDLGADDRVVTVVQYLRVLLVLLAMPIVTTLIFHPPSGAGALSTGPTRWLPDLVFVVLSVGIGLLLQKVVTAPATALLGPMLVAVAISASGVLGQVSVPTALENLGYALIGVRVGLRFTRASLRSIAKLLPLATLLILAVIAACGLLGVVLSKVTGVDELTAYLATTPGGLFAVLATAADSGSDVTYVLAVQVIRVFAMLLLAPLLGRWLRRASCGGCEPVEITRDSRLGLDHLNQPVHQSKQNSLPSGSCITMMPASMAVGSIRRNRLAPSATSRSHSASSASIRSSPSRPGAARTSRWTRFFTVLPSGTCWKNSRGPLPSGSCTAERELRSSGGTPQASRASSQVANPSGGSSRR